MSYKHDVISDYPFMAYTSDGNAVTASSDDVQGIVDRIEALEESGGGGGEQKTTQIFYGFDSDTQKEVLYDDTVLGCYEYDIANDTYSDTATAFDELVAGKCYTIKTLGAISTYTVASVALFKTLEDLQLYVAGSENNAIQIIDSSFGFDARIIIPGYDLYIYVNAS